jgi:hypothetical protein
MRREGQQRLTIIPLTWREAGAFVDRLHRHHSRSRGQKFAIGVVDESGVLRGVAQCGRPISREISKDNLILEINRTCVDGCPNANSALYGACYRIAMAMGYKKVITDIQEGESGVSLKAAGFVAESSRRPRKNWADSSVKLRHIRNSASLGDVGRTRWCR